MNYQELSKIHFEGSNFAQNQIQNALKCAKKWLYKYLIIYHHKKT
jgi:hypothetical protein